MEELGQKLIEEATAALPVQLHGLQCLHLAPAHNILRLFHGTNRAITDTCHGAPFINYFYSIPVSTRQRGSLTQNMERFTNSGGFKRGPDRFVENSAAKMAAIAYCCLGPEAPGL